MQKVISAIKQLLETSVSNSNSPIHDVKKVFFGDPLIIPADDLPAIAIQPINTAFEMRGSRYDQKTHSIEIRLIYNQKQYFGMNLGDSKTITSALYSTGSITFDSIGHGLKQGDSVVVSGITPETINGTFLVTSIPDLDHFIVAKSIDVGIYISGGIVQKATTDKVFAVEDAINKVEQSDSNHSTAQLSVCGVIQSNSSLPYSDGVNTLNAAEIAQIKSVNYTFSENRGFPTFEVVATLEATLVGDR